jgi:hypothetical protein
LRQQPWLRIALSFWDGGTRDYFTTGGPSQVIVDRDLGKNRQEGTIIDLSSVAAKRRYASSDRHVKLEVLAWGNGNT